MIKNKGVKILFVVNVLALIFNITRAYNPDIYTFSAGLNLGFILMFGLIIYYEK